MPYIEKETRIPLEYDVTRGIETVGELNYMLTCGLLKVPLSDLEEYLRLCVGTYATGKIPSYTLFNGAIGACMCALLEYARRTGSTDHIYPLIMSAVISKFYSKVIAPYEDEKIEENGDIEGYADYSEPYELLPEEEAGHA